MGPNRNSQGFTLIETLVTLVIMGIVGIALFQMLNVSRGTVEDQKATLEAQQNARVALNSISEDFRHVSYGKDATQPSIFHAEIDSVVFVADIFHDYPGAEVISYYLSADGDGDTPNPNDRILMKTVTDTTGAVLVNAPQSYGMAASGLQLRYYNGNGVELASPVSQPETIGEISVVVSGVSPRPMQNGDYFTVTLSTTIYPRNLPLTPARSRPNPPIFTGISVPNCEAVTLSWDPPTTNTDGTDLPFNDISHFNFYMGDSPTSLNLHARLARTIGEWTVADLVGGEYFFAITCVSRAGVESYPYEESVDLAEGFVAAEPAVTTTTTATGVRLDWDPVSMFEDGETITTPIYYNVYRSETPGFVADESALIASTGDGVVTYHDGGLTGCNTYYYQVAAVACENDGVPSAEVQGLFPAPVACVTNIDGTLGITAGEVLLTWQAPTLRQDGTSLDESEIDHYYVYHDTIPGSFADSTLVPSGGGTPPTAWTLLGLVPCRTYYMNVRAVDDCGNRGDVCPASEFTIATSSPCTPGPPEPVTGLVASVGDDRILLKWDPNTNDCDLQGYRIHYGYAPGGPYGGVGAWEGNSPIQVAAEDVTSGATCSFDLTGLDLCSDYFVVVTAVDRCIPFEEGDPSNEIVGGTSCINCDIVAACSPWVTHGGSNNYVRVPIHDDGDQETVTRMRLDWDDSGAKLEYVWAAETLVWAHDGSAGDGSGLAGSGTDLDVEDFEIPDWASDLNMFHLTFKFTGDMRNGDVDATFWAGGAPCSISGTPKPSLLLDDFEDGDYNGWTVDAGNWRVEDGVLEQTNSGGGTKWIHTSSLSWGSDFVFEAATQIATGGYSILQFNRYASGYRYVGLLYYWGQTANIATMIPGYTDLAYTPYSFNEGEWHKVRVELEGGTCTMSVDCNPLVYASIYPEPPNGRFGFGTYASYALFDDVVITER